MIYICTLYIQVYDIKFKYNDSGKYKLSFKYKNTDADHALVSLNFDNKLQYNDNVDLDDGYVDETIYCGDFSPLSSDCLSIFQTSTNVMLFVLADGDTVIKMLSKNNNASDSNEFVNEEGNGDENDVIDIEECYGD